MGTIQPFAHADELTPGSQIADVSGALPADAGGAGANADNQVLQRIGVSIGTLGMLFSGDGGREVMPPPTVSRIPNTVSWLQGLANVRGDLVPVVDTAAAFGVTRTVGQPVYLLIFGRGDSAIGLLIDGLPSLLNMDIAQRLDQPPPLPALLEGSVVAAYEHANRTWVDVDLSLLFGAFARNIALY